MKNKLMHPVCKSKDCDNPAINGDYCDRCAKKKKEDMKKGAVRGGISFIIGCILFFGKPIISLIYKK